MLTLDETRAEAVEDALEGLGLPWRRRGDGWAVPAGPGRPRELLVALAGDAVRAEAELCSGEGLGGVQRQALAVVLGRAAAELPLVAVEARDGGAVVAAEVPGGDLDRRLRPAVAAVLAAARHLAGACDALLAGDLAAHAVRFLGDGGRA